VKKRVWSSFSFFPGSETVHPYTSGQAGGWLPFLKRGFRPLFLEDREAEFAVASPHQESPHHSFGHDPTFHFCPQLLLEKFRRERHGHVRFRHQPVIHVGSKLEENRAFRRLYPDEGRHQGEKIPSTLDWNYPVGNVADSIPVLIGPCVAFPEVSRVAVVPAHALGSAGSVAAIGPESVEGEGDPHPVAADLNSHLVPLEHTAHHPTVLHVL